MPKNVIPEGSCYDIILISPYHGLKKNSFPWGVFSIASYLTNIRKKRVKILEIDIPSRAAYKRALNESLALTKVIGIGFFSTDAYVVKCESDYIKQRTPHIKIIVGGPHAILESEQTCRYKNIDFVAYGEGEETVAALTDELSCNNQNWDKIPGLLYKQEGEIKKTALSKTVGFYNMDYTLLSECTQKKLGDYIEVLSGRGCPYQCSFCYNSVIQAKVQLRDIEDLLQELTIIIDVYHPKVIYFRDENFFASQERVVKFLDAYRQRKFTFHWIANCRANYVSKEYINLEFLRNLAASNCCELRFGMECGSQRMLDYVKKGIDLNEIRRAVEMLAAVPTIRGAYSFMTGLPTQKYAEYIDTLKLIKFILSKTPHAMIFGPQYFRMYPGGRLYNEVVKEYDFKKPNSFSEWAVKPSAKNDPLGLFKLKTYPWVPARGKYLAFYSNWIIYLSQKKVLKCFHLKHILILPFVLIAKIRVKYDWYAFLWEMVFFDKLLVKVYRFLQQLI